MKGTIITSLLLLAFTVAKGQSNEFGTIGVHAGAGIGVYATLADFKYDGVQIDKDTSAAAAYTFPIEVQFGLHRLFSIGAYAKFGRYIDEDPNDENVETEQNSVSSFGITPKFYMVNKDRFNLYLGCNIGATALNQEKTTNSGSFTAREKWRWNATNVMPHLGFNAYFGETAGLFFDVGYDAHNFKLSEYTFNDDPADLSRFDYQFDAKGVYLNLGVALKFM